MRIFVLFLFVLFSSILTAQVTNALGYPLNLYQQFNGPYDYTIIGKSHNPTDRYQNPNPSVSTLLTGSSTVLTLPPGHTIVGAYLVWAGVGNGAGTSLALNGVTQFPDSIQTISIGINVYLPYYKAIKDITPFVQGIGNGVYQVTNLNYAYTSNYNYEYFQGWNIIVIHSNPNLANKQINMYDGFVSNVALPVTCPVTNLFVTNTAGAKVSYITYGSSNNYWMSPELVQFNGMPLSNPQNPVNHMFNSTHVNGIGNTSYQLDVDTYDISNCINVGDTSGLLFTFAFYTPYFSTLITSIQSELPDATISLDSITGQDICQNHDLTLDYTVYNVNALDTLMAGTPISVFVNDSILISTVNLPSNILIGDSLSLSTLVTIPPGVSNPFNLSMVVNQNSTQLGVVYESNLTNNASNDTLIHLIEIIYPDFGTIGPICEGVNYSLPTTSMNGVDGTWSPAFNNLVGGTYYFMPNDTTCNQPLQLTVEIEPLTSPVFNIIDSICQSASLLLPLATQPLTRLHQPLQPLPWVVHLPPNTR
jgi:hypothetical protein